MIIKPLVNDEGRRENMMETKIRKGKENKKRKRQKEIKK